MTQKLSRCKQGTLRYLSCPTRASKVQHREDGSSGHYTLLSCWPAEVPCVGLLQHLCSSSCSFIPLAADVNKTSVHAFPQHLVPSCQRRPWVRLTAKNKKKNKQKKDRRSFSCLLFLQCLHFTLCLCPDEISLILCCFVQHSPCGYGEGAPRELWYQQDFAVDRCAVVVVGISTFLCKMYWQEFPVIYLTSRRMLLPLK